VEGGGRFSRWTLGRCYGRLCALAVVERLDEKIVSKDNDRLGGDVFRFIVETRRRRYDNATPRGFHLFNRFKSQNRAALVNSLLLSRRDVLSTNMPMRGRCWHLTVRKRKLVPELTQKGFPTKSSTAVASTRRLPASYWRNGISVFSCQFHYRRRFLHFAKNDQRSVRRFFSSRQNVNPWFLANNILCMYYSVPQLFVQTAIFGVPQLFVHF
jgi:hypothetical protein